jgi:hypothetical protein
MSEEQCRHCGAEIVHEIPASWDTERYCFTCYPRSKLLKTPVELLGVRCVNDGPQSYWYLLEELRNARYVEIVALMRGQGYQFPGDALAERMAQEMSKYATQFYFMSTSTFYHNMVHIFFIHCGGNNE